jgi:hypothetical protein
MSAHIHADYTGGGNATAAPSPAYTPEQVDAAAAVLASAFIPGVPWEHCGAKDRTELRKRASAALDAADAARESIAARDWDRVHNRPADIYTPPEDRIIRPATQRREP